uniref:Uncharacterized protein n=1 Tax=Amphimedon queenslandica TaxID=400682 RepID=A0A1X7VSN6_AMPQE
MIKKFATSVIDVTQVNSRDITVEEENEDEFPLESLTEELIVDLACSEAEDGCGDERDDDEPLMFLVNLVIVLCLLKKLAFSVAMNHQLMTQQRLW